MSAAGPAACLLGAARPGAPRPLYRVGQARAAVAGRGFVTPDEGKAMAAQVVTPRVVVNPQTRLRGRTPEEIVREVVNTVRVPVEA